MSSRHTYSLSGAAASLYTPLTAAAARVVPELSGQLDILHKISDLVGWAPYKWTSELGKTPLILDPVESLCVLLIDRSLSLSRIADGELGLMTRVKEPNSGRQHYSDSLGEELRKVMSCDMDRCCVALPKWFMYRMQTRRGNDMERFSYDEFYIQSKKGKYFDFYRSDYVYLDACLSVPKAHYSSLGEEFITAYYDVAKHLFKGDLIIVTGDPRHTASEHNLFEMSRSIEILIVPRTDAWNSHDEIKRMLIDMNPDGSRTVVLSCGATASVLAYELSDRMRCLDIGHMPIDYVSSKGGHIDGWFWG